MLNYYELIDIKELEEVTIYITNNAEYHGMKMVKNVNVKKFESMVKDNILTVEIWDAIKDGTELYHGKK